MRKTAWNEGERSACVVHAYTCVLDGPGQGKHQGESLRAVQESWMKLSRAAAGLPANSDGERKQPCNAC